MSDVQETDRNRSKDSLSDTCVSTFSNDSMWLGESYLELLFPQRDLRLERGLSGLHLSLLRRHLGARQPDLGLRSLGLHLRLPRERRAVAVRVGKRGGATRASKAPTIPDGRLVWSASTWKPSTDAENPGGPCGDVLLACRHLLEQAQAPDWPPSPPVPLSTYSLDARRGPAPGRCWSKF